MELSKGTVVKAIGRKGHVYYYKYLYTTDIGLYRVKAIANWAGSGEQTLSRLIVAKAHEVAKLKKDGKI